jgi:hypothetical protein
MSDIDKRPYRADGGDIGAGRLKEIGDNVYGDEEKCWLAKRVLTLLDELEAKDRRIEEEIGRANREHHRGFMMACGHLKEHSNVHYADAAEMEIAALRKRINELESAAAGKGE